MCSVWCSLLILVFFFFFKQKTAYEMRISDWSSDVCSSDLHAAPPAHADLKPQLAGAITQDQFHLGIALKAFRHARHFLARALPARHVAGAIEAVAPLFEALPAFPDPIGAHVPLGPHARSSEQHTPELHSTMPSLYAVIGLKK